VPFDNLTTDLRERANALLAEWLKRPKHAKTLPGSRAYWYLVGSAARYALYGPPPNRNQRLAYRMHKKRRAKLEAIKLYGNPLSPDSH